MGEASAQKNHFAFSRAVVLISEALSMSHMPLPG
jgi:hypothetical protein